MTGHPADMGSDVDRLGGDERRLPGGGVAWMRERLGAEGGDPDGTPGGRPERERTRPRH